MEVFTELRGDGCAKNFTPQINLNGNPNNNGNLYNLRTNSGGVAGETTLEEVVAYSILFMYHFNFGLTDTLV